MYCNKCGAELPDGSKFCTNCGTSFDGAETKIETVSNSGNNTGGQKIKCTRCRSRNLHPLNEDTTTSQTKGSNFSAGKGCMGYLLFGPLGILCGSCGQSQKTTTTTTHKTYWVCKDCGNKFKDLDTLEAEIATAKKQIAPVIAMCLLGAIFMILFFLLPPWKSDTRTAMRIIGVCGVIFMTALGIGSVCKSLNDAKNAQEEYDNTKRIFME